MSQALPPASSPCTTGNDPSIETPAFVIDLQAVSDAVATARSLATAGGCKLLYSVKALAVRDLLSFLRPHVDGFSASSLNECLLARDVLGPDGLVHFTAPGYRRSDAAGIARAADRIAFNSLSQWAAAREWRDSRAQFGLRVNPGLSYVSDPRYAPCLPGSRLGITLGALKRELSKPGEGFQGLSGVHVHCNCDSRDLRQLAATARWLRQNAGFLLERCTWVNLGGGYLFDQPSEAGVFIDSVNDLRSAYSLEVFLEPGAALVHGAARLEASILDIHEADGKSIAVLDASVNHLPNVFSYQEPPTVHGVHPAGRFRYTLAGPTCLAGDVFGTYGFEHSLEVDDRIIFPDVGAYTLAKSHMFNGVALPAIYVQRAGESPRLVRRYGFEDFASIYAAAPLAAPDSP